MKNVIKIIQRKQFPHDYSVEQIASSFLRYVRHNPYYFTDKKGGAMAIINGQVRVISDPSLKEYGTEPDHVICIYTYRKQDGIITLKTLILSQDRTTTTTVTEQLHLHK